MSIDDIPDQQQLAHILANEFDEEHIEEVILAIATFAHLGRTNGLLSLEGYIHNTNSHVAATLLRMIVDGIEPSVVNKAAGNLKKAMLYRREVYLEVLIQGIESVQQGESPRVLMEKLYSILGKNPPTSIYVPVEETRDPSDSVLSQEEVDTLLTTVSGEIHDGDHSEFEGLILGMSDRDLQCVFRAIDPRDLALAMKRTSKSAARKLFSNKSIRAASMLRDDIKYMGAVRDSDVDFVKGKIVSTIKKLAEAGDVIINQGEA